MLVALLLTNILNGVLRPPLTAFTIDTVEAVCRANAAASLVVVPGLERVGGASKLKGTNRSDAVPLSFTHPAVGSCPVMVHESASVFFDMVSDSGFLEAALSLLPASSTSPPGPTLVFRTGDI